MLRPKQKLFIQFYTDIKSSGFYNGAEAYRLAYRQGVEIAKRKEKSADNCKDMACRLLAKPEIKSTIERIMKPILDLSKEDYTAKVELELQNCKNPSVRARLLELIGKVHNFTKDNEIQNTTVIFQEAQEKLKSRLNSL